MGWIQLEGKAMAIYCMQCGKELPDDAKFCLKCGKPLTSTEAGDPQIPDNPWESVRPLWRERAGMEDMGEEGKRRLVEQQIIKEVLERAKKLINALYASATTLSREKFFDHCSRIGGGLHDLYVCSPDWDEKAEIHYQDGRLRELAAKLFGRFSLLLEEIRLVQYNTNMSRR